MQDTELYRYLLGIEAPWMVKRVELDMVNHRVDVWADHAEGLRWPCPECGTLVPLYDHAAERTCVIWTVGAEMAYGIGEIRPGAYKSLRLSQSYFPKMCFSNFTLQCDISD